LKLFLEFQEGVELVLVEFCLSEDLAGLFLAVPKIGVGGLRFEFLDFLGEKWDVKDTS
jgi:hypothetical protein